MRIKATWLFFIELLEWMYYINQIYKKRWRCTVVFYAPAERGSHRLKASFGSCKKWISHLSFVFECTYSSRRQRVRALIDLWVPGFRELGWYRGIIRPIACFVLWDFLCSEIEVVIQRMYQLSVVWLIMATRKM